MTNADRENYFIQRIKEDNLEDGLVVTEEQVQNAAKIVVAQEARFRREPGSDSVRESVTLEDPAGVRDSEGPIHTFPGIAENNLGLQVNSRFADVMKPRFSGSIGPDGAAQGGRVLGEAIPEAKRRLRGLVMDQAGIGESGFGKGKPNSPR
jgi:hypothetical protein